jgi:hypothetical protein
MIPKRSVPRIFFSIGRQTTATSTGAQAPARFQTAILASKRPLVSDAQDGVPSAGVAAGLEDITVDSALFIPLK